MKNTLKPRVYKRGPYWIARVYWFSLKDTSNSYVCGSWEDAIRTALNGGPLMEVTC